jgi:hypothetical protein
VFQLCPTASRGQYGEALRDCPRTAATLKPASAKRLKSGEKVPEGTTQFDRLWVKMHLYDADSADSARPWPDFAQL